MEIPSVAPIAVLAAACAPCLPPPAAEDPGDPPPYDSAPGLRRTPRGDRRPPPRLDEGVLVEWDGGSPAVRLPLRRALLRARSLHQGARLSGPDFEGRVEASGNWSIRATRT